MSFSNSKFDDEMPLAEINMVPLIDVMLVLLVIFIVTAPLLTHTVQLNLPQASSVINKDKISLPIQLSIDAENRVFWNAQLCDSALLSQKLKSVSLLKTIPPVHIYADKKVAYEKVALVMSEAARLGVTKIGIVTEPSLP
jgi:biopolymer transport protein ExbD